MDAPVPKKVFVPSPQQAAVLEWVTSGKGSVFVEAVAGAGKTTTLLESVKRMKGQVALVAFNKKIADELNFRLEGFDIDHPRVKVLAGTFHSFGLRSWMAVKRVRVDSSKARRIAKALDTPKDLVAYTIGMVSQAKQRGLGCPGQPSMDDNSAWEDIALRFGFETYVPAHQAYNACRRVLLAHIQDSSQAVDFDDMLYMPAYQDMRMVENDFLLVDECQDLNGIRRIMARKMLKAKGRAMFVGDRHQAIYGFSGADSDSVDRIVESFACKALPLTVTFRCPKAVVNEARSVVSHITAAPSAPEGTVSRLEYTQFMKTELKPGKDAILCRNTKPLVSAAYELISNGVGAYVEGRDIGSGLIKLISKFSATRTSVLLQQVNDYTVKEVEKMKKADKLGAIDALIDRCDTIHVLAEGCDTVAQIIDKINLVFEESANLKRPLVCLSTIHKAKGREWERVFFLGCDELIPSRFAKADWELEQEDNLIYVGITRAMSELVYVSLPEPRK